MTGAASKRKVAPKRGAKKARRAPPASDGRVARAQSLREHRRRQILDAAARVFAQKGFEPGSIADIIEEAGIARGTFYLHFQSKQQIFEQLVDALLAALAGSLERVDPAAPTPLFDQLEANLRRIFDVLIENVAVTRILLAGTSLGPVDEHIQAFYEECLALIRGSLWNGQQLGLVRALDVDVVAFTILGGLKETVAQLLDRAPIDRGSLARMLLDYHLHGALARP